MMRGSMKDGGPLERARNAFGRHAWSEAQGLYDEALSQAALEPADMEAHADAAFWSGRPDECMAIRERAYALYKERGDRQSSARLALELSRDYGLKGVSAVAAAWFVRATKALDGEPRWPEHAKLEIAKVMMQGHDTPAARASADRALELASKFGDRDSLAMAVMLQGMALINDGKLK